MQKNIKILSVLIFSTLFFLAFFVKAFHVKSQNNSLPESRSDTEEIADYDVTIEIQRDSSLVISEKILYDFKSRSRHGIFRDIPYKYKDQKGANYNLRLKVISVTDEKGAGYRYETNRKGKDFSIKIGDPDKFVTGQKTYLIKYRVERGMRYFKDHDELYWNAIGHGWNLNILKGGARVILPKEIKKEDLKYACFTGPFGFTEKNCQIKVVDKKTVDFVLTAWLPKYSGLTIVLGMPKGVIQRSSFYKEIGWFVFDNWPLLLIPFSFVLVSYLWWTRGRDPKGWGTIIAQYDPPDDLRPGEVGVIVDQDVDNKDISSTLIDLAARGYLKIKETAPSEYEFIKLKESRDLLDYEKELFDDIFGQGQTKRLSDLKNKFADKLASIEDTLYHEVTRKGYFPKNPKMVKGRYLSFGVFVTVAAFFLGIFLQSITYFLGFFVSGLFFVIFSFFMSRRSYRGILAYEHTLGFKEFLSVTEKERLKFFQAPEKKPELFERFLPYAMVLGVENQWAGQFEGIYKQKPSFYESYDSRPFTAYTFASTLNSLSSRSISTFSSLPPKTTTGRFGGTGFGGGVSGGGGGGGGGGGW